MSETTPFQSGATDDEAIVRTATERLTDDLGRAPADVEREMRKELGRWRHHARVQTFVPILAERAARQRLLH
jgi:hypothetical protein